METLCPAALPSWGTFWQLCLGPQPLRLTWYVVWGDSLVSCRTGIELTLQIQSDVGVRATLKEFKERLAGDKYQGAVQALREEVESFASLFPLPGLPDF